MLMHNNVLFSTFQGNKALENLYRFVSTYLYTCICEAKDIICELHKFHYQELHLFTMTNKFSDQISCSFSKDLNVWSFS